MNEIRSLLKSEFGIVLESIVPATGGFSTKAAYRVTDTDSIEYFLKVYDKYLPTTRFFVERIDEYMPVLDWLTQSSALRAHILTPIKTRGGKYKAETADDVYVMFLFVRGSVPGIKGMTRSQTAELAEILALLHDIGANVPFDTAGLSEDIAMPFCERLQHFLFDCEKYPVALSDIIAPYSGMICEAVSQTLRLRDTVRAGYSPLVLCHGDAHGNNVIQSGRLVLADWEDLRLAPAEADLFIYMWHPHGDVLLETYSSIRRGYKINQELLYFYTMRRRIEDVWVDIQRLTEEFPDETETAQLINYIQIGIDEVRKLYTRSAT